MEGFALSLINRTPIDGVKIALWNENAPYLDFGFDYFDDFPRELKHLPLATTADYKYTEGWNLGLFNFGAMDGVQIGLFNSVSGGDAWQFGLLNYNKNGILPIMPFFNCTWGDDDELKDELEEKSKGLLVRRLLSL